MTEKDKVVSNVSKEGIEAFEASFIGDLNKQITKWLEENPDVEIVDHQINGFGFSSSVSTHHYFLASIHWKTKQVKEKNEK